MGPISDPAPGGIIHRRRIERLEGQVKERRDLLAVK
jgi:hypothetical protein